MAPGTEAVVALAVTNDGELVEDVELEPLGVAAGWCHIEPPEVRPKPGATAVANLVVTLPPEAAEAGEEVGSDTWRVLVRARSLSDTAVVPVELRSTWLRLTLDPQAARVHRRGTVRLTLHRTGGQANGPFIVPVRLRAVADPAFLKLGIAAEVTVGADPVSVPLTVRPSRSGPPIGYRVEATEGNQPPVVATGQVEERGPSLWPALVVTVVLLTLVLGAVLLFGPDLAPRPY